VVRSGRDGTCRLEPSIVTSDAHRFVALCRAAGADEPAAGMAAAREARALYRGELLSCASYDWAQDRGEGGLTLAERYRDMHRKVTGRLAYLCFVGGRIDEAIPLYKEMLDAEPILEETVRNLFRCYHKLGDRAGLVREERHLRQALKEWYYDPREPADDPAKCQPAPETVALFGKLLSDLDARAATNRRLLVDQERRRDPVEATDS
jgi:two-component SAPR family response regulator